MEKEWMFGQKETDHHGGWIKAWGTVRYYDRWCIMYVDNEICNYYRQLYYYHVYKCKKLIQGKYPGHITIVSKYERDKAKESVWGKYEGRKIKFRYRPIVKVGSLYAVINDIDCSFLYGMREELGLPRQPYQNFHITIGNFKNA